MLYSFEEISERVKFTKLFSIIFYVFIEINFKFNISASQLVK